MDPDEITTSSEETWHQLMAILKEIELRIPPPQDCHHCLTFSRYGSDADGWQDKLALQINRDGKFYCVFIDPEDFDHTPEQWADQVAYLLSQSFPWQMGKGPGQYQGKTTLEKAETELDGILVGIDKEENVNGWWETSTGAEFGAKKLRELRAFLRRLLT